MKILYKNYMNNSYYILLPVNSWFIIFSLIVAFFLNFLQFGQWIGTLDFVALVLIFWSIHEPRKIGINVAFIIGLLMDVNKATFLGENALIYTLLSYFSITIRRRVLLFSVSIQALHIFLVLFLIQILQLIVHFLVNNQLPYWYYFSQSFFCTILWPLVTWLLLVPQRRANNNNENNLI